MNPIAAFLRKLKENREDERENEMFNLLKAVGWKPEDAAKQVKLWRKKFYEGEV